MITSVELRGEGLSIPIGYRLLYVLYVFTFAGVYVIPESQQTGLIFSAQKAFCSMSTVYDRLSPRSSRHMF